MACHICNRHEQWHGSQEPNAQPGTYLHEMGCHQGVRMDDDDYGEGWEPDVVYPPCRFNPSRCLTCDGTGNAPPLMAEALNRDDCADCDGTGWKDGKAQWPSSADDIDQQQPPTPPKAAG